MHKTVCRKINTNCRLHSLLKRVTETKSFKTIPVSQFRRGRGHAQRKALQKDTRAGENVRPKEVNVPDNKGLSHDMTASNHKPENANAPNNNKPTNDKTASHQNRDDKVGKRYYSGSPNTYQVEIMFAGMYLLPDIIVEVGGIL